MSVWIMPPVAGLIEPALAPEIVADGIGAIEQCGGNVRIFLFKDELSLDPIAKIASRVVSARIFSPLVTVPECIGRLATALNGLPIPGVVPDPGPNGGGRFPHIVR